MKGLTNPLVSIIILTYNRAKLLIEALESVLAQTYRNIEIIVVNDASPDNTEEVLLPYMKHIRYIKNEKNLGCAGSKNVGLEAARGELITNLDDDDCIKPEKIARQVERFRERPQMGVCATGTIHIDKDGQHIRTYMPPRFSRRNQTLLFLRKCQITQSSAMIAQRVHDHLGPYRLTWGEDYDFWLRVSLHYEIGVVRELLTEYRVHGDQMTGPEHEVRLNSAVKKVVGDFLTETPLSAIIPGLQSEPEGQAIIGLLLAEQKLYAQAEMQLKQASPHPACDLGIGLIRLLNLDFNGAKSHFEAVQSATDVVFRQNGADAMQLLKQAQWVIDISGVHNTHPAVNQLRKELSSFQASVIRQLLRIARREEGDLK